MAECIIQAVLQIIGGNKGDQGGPRRAQDGQMPLQIKVGITLRFSRWGGGDQWCFRGVPCLQKLEVLVYDGGP